jgi:cobalt/nickel transport system permease protein
MGNALYQVNFIDSLARENKMINNIYPVYKLIITFLFITLVVSINKYNVTNLLLMASYLIISFTFSDLSIITSIKKIKYVLPVILLMGIFNPIMNREVYINIGNIPITYGLISMFTLFIKGLFTVLASYLLIATTTIEKICYALRKLMIPEIIVTQILLTYRYLTVLLTQANSIFQAYSLRAPHQKGVHHKVWGSLTGQLLMRSIDSANDIYQSMLLRGYNGNFEFLNISINNKDNYYLLIYTTILFTLRFINI